MSGFRQDIEFLFGRQSLYDILNIDTRATKVQVKYVTATFLPMWSYIGWHS